MAMRRVQIQTGRRRNTASTRQQALPAETILEVNRVGLGSSDSGTPRHLPDHGTPHSPATATSQSTPNDRATGGREVTTQFDNETTLLTVSEVAHRLRVKSSWVYNHADTLGAFHLGKYLRFDWSVVLQQIERRP